MTTAVVVLRNSGGAEYEATGAMVPAETETGAAVAVSPSVVVVLKYGVSDAGAA